MTLTFEFQGQIAAIFKYYMIDKVFINAFHLKYPNTGFSSLRTHKQAVLYILIYILRPPPGSEGYITGNALKRNHPV